MDKTCENNYDDTYRPPLQRLFKIGGKSLKTALEMFVHLKNHGISQFVIPNSYR